MESIRDFRIDIPPDWTYYIERCKVIEFLNGENGEEIVADFLEDLRKQNGSRFNASLKIAVKRLSLRTHAYFLTREINPAPYQAFDLEVLDCLEQSFDEKTALEVTGAAIISILREQDASL